MNIFQGELMVGALLKSLLRSSVTSLGQPLENMKTYVGCTSCRSGIVGLNQRRSQPTAMQHWERQDERYSHADRFEGFIRDSFPGYASIVEYQGYD
jgi:hypothetical protein